MILNKLKKVLVIASVSLLSMTAFTTAEAGVVYHHNHRHYYHRHYSNGFGPGVLIGSAFGFLAGALVASSQPGPTYYYHRECRRVFVNCYQRGNYFNSYRVCRRTVRWVWC